MPYGQWKAVSEKTMYRVVQNVFVTFDFLPYISYKTTFKKKCLKLSLGRFL